MANYSEIRNAILGKAFDIDGYYGPQCWDGIMYVAEKYLGGKRVHCGVTGYVKDIALQRSTNGILTWCKDVGLSATLQPGDICIWGNCQAAPLSHIAFYDHDNGPGHVFFLGQNQGGAAGAFTINEIPVSGIIAVFRPNAFAQIAKKSVSELAAEVYAGKWGTGTARKEALEKAGYDYAAVQAEVNLLVAAKDVIAGKYGNGSTRTAKLKAAGYDPAAVQKKVNELLKA